MTGIAHAARGSPTEMCELQRSYQVEDQSGVSPLLESRKTGKKHGYDAEGFGDPDEGKQIGRISQMRENSTA